ncbi:MAG: helix-turn-helix domain-containing protein [Erysipelotrichaceae bacterium]|nr:helix-turn-helix domain-containing protein [Erysipelotrichaceae bacterium]
MDIRDMREALGDTQKEFSFRFNIPVRTIQNWEAGVRQPPEYVIDLLNDRVCSDLVNRMTIEIPKYDEKRKNLPKRSDYIGNFAWLKAVQECLGESFVFALDEALMCHGYFKGRNDEYIVWGYGDKSATRYNGVVLLSNTISNYNIEVRNGLKFTDFNRTIVDALTNEKILDMQGITEAISRYYYANNESLKGIHVPPEYIRKFEKIAKESIEYYNS